MQEQSDTLQAVHPLTIPTRHIPAFEHIRDLGDSDFEALLNSLQNAQPTRRVDDLATQVMSSADIDEELSRAVLEALTEFITLFDQWPSEPALLAARAAANTELAIPSRERTRFAQRIVSLAGATPLRLLGKAIALRMEHARILTESRMFTDLRPIFDSSLDNAPKPEAMLMVHTLKLEYIASDNTLENIYIVLDEDDIEVLGTTLDRARQKSDILKATLAEVGIVDMSQEADRES